MQEVLAYTDGSALDNGKPYARCGAGVVLICGELMKELSIPLPNCISNNQAELSAAIEALKALKFPCKITIVTDSEYVRRGITEWMQGWIRRGWKTANKGGDVKNRELWEELNTLCEIHSVTWKWVKGHGTDKMNILADKLAVAASGSLVKGGVV